MRSYEHVRPTGLYRSRKGAIMGVCKGFAQYFGFPVAAVRVVAVILLLVSGFWPITIIYFIAAYFMKPEPVLPLGDESEREFYESYASSRSGAAQRLKRKFENIDRRIRRMEDVVTSRDYDWRRRFSKQGE
jgi:phage shock protein C